MGIGAGTILPGAMPWLHQYIGNPVLTKVLNIMFLTGVATATPVTAPYARGVRGWTANHRYGVRLGDGHQCR